MCVYRISQGKQENSRGILPVHLTSSGTDAGGVQPTPLITLRPQEGSESGQLSDCPANSLSNAVACSILQGSESGQLSAMGWTKGKERLPHPVFVHPTPLITVYPGKVVAGGGAKSGENSCCS